MALVDEVEKTMKQNRLFKKKYRVLVGDKEEQLCQQ